MLRCLRQERGRFRGLRRPGVRDNSGRGGRRAVLWRHRPRDPVGDTQDDVQEPTGSMVVRRGLRIDSCVVVMIRMGFSVGVDMGEPTMGSDAPVIRGEEMHRPEQDLTEIDQEERERKK